ncbi:phosphoenolpyruvate carboxykinase (ATP) [Sphingobacterium humi]|uniref:Phosphoenolpyruvate carboxykinase (ATP) n=1 Tax=Sphingobacterium humi TaxID=1796905 RepID=A0A6N8KZY8_9SPHI|nr:phosphoenolpyruvate carboxykinase (ATP) [Sphingobacterium humi]MVZ62617.1 phosphoenolpyruvate carboxykinase (ATP) [Sphingobacterium humi]
MMQYKTISNLPDLTYLKIELQNNSQYQLPPAALVEEAIQNKEGELADNGALCIMTGKFTGRSPKDRFIVLDAETTDKVNWNAVNQPMSEEHFTSLWNQVADYLSKESLYILDAKACAEPTEEISIRVVSTLASHNLFASNLFINNPEAKASDQPDWSILVAPKYLVEDFYQFGLNNENFVAINFSKKIVLIAGTGYTGEIKKSIFTVLNYLLPTYKQYLTMHCSANRGENGETALYFGLSGTGKTTLSSDKRRQLIGDDEHVWTADQVFNIEGGCYAKCIGLTEESEPEIYQAVRFNALLENVKFKAGTRTPDYQDKSITENIRVSYPLEFIENIVPEGRGAAPKHIFFLAADAFGVLPPISKLSVEQAMYYFINGYTSKIAGTEAGITTPQATFSACFGQAFLPLHPSTYADLLGKKLQEHEDIQVWLVNTGWVAGPYGVGNRIKLSYTRTLIREALAGKLGQEAYREHPVFGLQMPTHCEGVAAEVLNPVELWADAQAYEKQAKALKGLFEKNYEQFRQK